jgi:N6-adenosine-specific RNA methylase IME4
MIGESSCKTQVTGLDGIAVSPNRLRALNQSKINTLVESMSRQGLLHPILVRPRSDTGFTLIAGWHRLEAARQLKWDTIRVEIREGVSDEQAELDEIDENLIRGELSPAETAIHHARRKELYLIVHPEKARGKAPGGGRGKGKRPPPVFNFDDPPLEERKNCALPNYAEQAAAETGSSKRTVEMAVARGQIPGLAHLVGTSLDHGVELDALTKLPENEQRVLIERARAGEKVSAKTRAKQLNRETKECELGARQLALPDKRFGVILADPEWRFEPWSRETGMDRAADNHYPTSCLEAIKSRDVPSISADDCVLFLWATIPMLPHALLVMAAWGFDYKSHHVWVKDKDGTGYWNRERHELLLIGTRGDIPCPAPGNQWSSVLMAPRGKHSAKPEQVLEMIEQYYPNLPKIELNRRGLPRQGWEAWGNEAIGGLHNATVRSGVG